MRVLLRIRGDVDHFPGGDYVQLLQTKAALEKLNIDCTVAPGVGRVEGRYDVVHLFNTTRIHETYLQYVAAKTAGIPVVLSPIWHSLRDMARFYGKLYHCPFFPINAYLATKEFFYARRSGLPVQPGAILKFRQMQRTVLEGCAAILPNSEGELSVLRRESGAQPRRVFISPLGFASGESLVEGSSERRDIVCAGRIEPRKNQLAVIRAFKRLPRDGRRLRLFGKGNESHPAYLRAVLAECMEGWVEYGGTVAQADLMAAYRSSRVAVLMSFFETFGLAALEGMAGGASLCLADTVTNRSIYGERAVYADPYSISSIQKGLQAAMDCSPSDDETFLRAYTWEKAAITTLAAYQYAAGA